MVIKLIDWIGRAITTSQIAKYLVKKLEPLRQKELELLERTKQEYIARGFSEERAKVYALYKLEYIETDPETICRINGIK